MKLIIGGAYQGKREYAVKEYGIKEEEKWRDSVILCREIFSGVVPVDVTVRAWREETGRVMTWLAGRAERVTRMFCGIPQQLK